MAAGTSPDPNPDFASDPGAGPASEAGDGAAGGAPSAAGSGARVSGPSRRRAPGGFGRREPNVGRRESAADTPERTWTVLIAALGGEGGGVLSSWLVDAASTEGRIVQATSVPGVAQRTGATTYYLESDRGADMMGRRRVLLPPLPPPMPRRFGPR